MDAEKKAKHVYKSITTKPPKLKITQMVWRQSVCDPSFDLGQMCYRIKQLTPVPKLQSFQYRVLWRAVVTNIHLYHWKIAESKLCYFCQECDETQEHLLAECEKVQPVWVACKEIINELGLGCAAVTKNNCMLDQISENNAANCICVIEKQYIYRQNVPRKI